MRVHTTYGIKYMPNEHQVYKVCKSQVPGYGVFQGIRMNGSCDRDYIEYQVMVIFKDYSAFQWAGKASGTGAFSFHTPVSLSPGSTYKFLVATKYFGLAQKPLGTFYLRVDHC